MIELFKLATHCGWHFAGVIWILALLVNFAFKMWNRLLRLIMVTARGWPPSHLDADGDHKPTKYIPHE